jgi:Tol biopolymer transport system component
MAMPARGFALSPDGRAAAVVRVSDGNEDIWVVDLDRGTSRRLTFDPAADAGAVWSPDGTRIAFYSGRRSGGGGVNDLYVTTLGQEAGEGPLLENTENKNTGDWSPDGRYILYSSQTPTTARDIWAVPVDGDRTPIVVLKTRFEESNPRFSPDGRWIAYQSNESGRAEVYVRPFMRDGPVAQVSTDGGIAPQWTQGGGEIIYRTAGRVFAAPVMIDERAATVRPGIPVPLFVLAADAGVAPASDGRRFLVRLPLDDAPASPITILLNWTLRSP